MRERKSSQDLPAIKLFLSLSLPFADLENFISHPIIAIINGRKVIDMPAIVFAECGNIYFRWGAEGRVRAWNSRRKAKMDIEKRTKYQILTHTSLTAQHRSSKRQLVISI